MRKRIARAWNLYRHGAALKGLLEAIGLWKWLVAGGDVAVGLILGYLSRLPLWARVLVGLASSAIVLFIAGFAVALYRVRDNSGKTRPRGPQDLELSIDNAIFKPRFNLLGSPEEAAEITRDSVMAASIFVRCKIINHRNITQRIHGAQLGVHHGGQAYRGDQLLPIPSSYVFYRKVPGEKGLRAQDRFIYDHAGKLRPERSIRPEDEAYFWVWFIVQGITATDAASSVLTLTLVCANEQVVACSRDAQARPWDGTVFLADTQTTTGCYAVSNLQGQRPMD